MSPPVDVLPTTDEVRAQVERILQSRQFRSAGVLRQLLAYLSEKCISGEGASLKEYSVGVDALGKPESFDPRQESVVRMHTARLRQKLADYYRTEGLNDPVVVDLPKGGFQLSFEQRTEDVSFRLPEALATNDRFAGWTRREFWLAGALAAASAVSAIAFWRHRQNDSESSDLWSPELKDLWSPLISSSRRLVVCMATPLFIDVPGFGAIRDASVDDWDNIDRSKGLFNVEKALSAGISSPSYDYTGVGTASGAFLLGQFLAARRPNVMITRSNLLSWPEIAEDNVVFLGPATGIHQSEDLSSNAMFVLEAGGIRNLAPGPGEAAFLPDSPAVNQQESGVSHALVSRMPAMNGHGAILILSGNHTSSVLAAVQACTNPALAKKILSRVRDREGRLAPYFQVVLNVKSLDEVPLEVSYLMHRELTAR